MLTGAILAWFHESFSLFLVTHAQAFHIAWAIEQVYYVRKAIHIKQFMYAKVKMY